MSRTATHRIPRVGIVGAGQLARMMLEAAIPLGIPVVLLADGEDDGAARVWPDVLIGGAQDPDALARLAAACDVITFDHELVDVTTLAELEAGGTAVRPSSTVLGLVQDKLNQRATLERLGAPGPEYRAVTTPDDVRAFADDRGWPVIVKAVRGGYDGRGVWKLDDPAAVEDLFAQVGATPLFVERMVRIEREVAIQVARRPGGEMATYPVVETIQVDGICRELRLPVDIPELMRESARELATRIATGIGLVGLLAVEMFVERDADGEPRLLVNELASRPHNSAHWTIEGSVTSQFAQHLRAVMDLPLGETTMVAPAVSSVNVLGAAGSSGDPAERLPEALADPAARVHLYGKATRPGRKIGHVTLVGDDLDDLSARAHRAAKVLSGEAVVTPGGRDASQ